MAWAMVAGAAISVVGGVVASNSAKKSAKEQAAAASAMNDKQLEANQVDPRIQQMLYGDGTKRLKDGVAAKWSDPDGNGFSMSQNPESDYQSSGLLGQYQDVMNAPQSAAMKKYGETAGDYLTRNGATDMAAIRAGAQQQMAGQAAPTMQAAMMQAPADGTVPLAQQSQIDLSSLAGMLGKQNAAGRGGTVPTVQASAIRGPSQNSLDLKPAYESMIYGDPGANPFLTGAIDKGIHQSQNAFGQMQRDATQNFNESIMPGVRGSALLSGQYGGTRQGIAEGRALSDYSKNEQRAISQMNQYNTDAAVAAQSQAYKEDMDRKAMLMQSLGGEQYGVAKADAANAQAASSQTAQNQLQYMLANMQYDAQGNQTFGNNMLAAATTNAGLAQQANLANQGATLAVGNANMGAQNSANNSNLQSQLTTNQLNSNNLGNGMAGLSGLLGSAYGNAATQDQYDMTKMSNGMGVLAPYLAKNATPTQLQPVYDNSGAAALGGALAGAQLGKSVYDGFKTPEKLVSPQSGQGYANGPAGQWYDGYGWNPN